MVAIFGQDCEGFGLYVFSLDRHRDTVVCDSRLFGVVIVLRF